MYAYTDVTRLENNLDITAHSYTSHWQLQRRRRRRRRRRTYSKRRRERNTKD